jgi:hypothetical protein
MPINRKDLAAVRTVLDGTVSLEEAIRDYSRRHSVITAVTILHAVERTLFTHKSGSYSKLLEALACYPAIPNEGFPEGIVRPKWYTQKTTDLLMVTSRKLGLHHNVRLSGVSSTILTNQPLLDHLIKEEGFRDKANELHDAVCTRQGIPLNKEPSARLRTRMMIAFLNPSVTSALRIDPDATVEQIRSALGAATEILEACFPRER